MKPFKRIYIEITNICNLSCSFCLPHHRKPRSLNIQEFTHIVNEIAPYTDYVYFHVKGEPLLHKDLDIFLQICAEHSLKVNLTTNGTLLEHSWKALKNSTSIRQINFSLHSFKDNSKIDFYQYINTIIQKTHYLSQHTNTVTSLRLWNLEKTLHKADENPENLSILKILKDEFQIEWELLNQVVNNHHGIKLAPNIYLNTDHEFEWPSLTNSTYDTKGTCYGLKNQLAILSDGSVVPCCLDGDRIIYLGDIFQSSLQDILKEERAQSIVNGFSNHQLYEELCKHCSFRKRFDK
jgi:radical SAM protein with 4Fe4S-binding SPASM domain